jgi:hypothetical protein
MSKKTVFPRIEVGRQALSDEAIVEHQRILKERESRIVKRFVANTGRFKAVPF